MENYFFDRKDVAGEPVDRVEARQKVTGAAKYAAEYKMKELTYGVLVTSTIAKGRIRWIDSKDAENAPGVLTVMTHLNRPEVPGWKEEKKPAEGEGRVDGKEFRVFYDDVIYFDHQPVALVIADTLERAAFAADLVKVSYQKEQQQTDMQANLSNAYKPKRQKDYTRGKPNAYKDAQVHIEASYHTPWQVHNPMEMHAATVNWEGEKITDYNKTQASKMAQKDIMTAFQLEEKNVYVQSPFVGGAFGSASRIWPQEMAAILGARKTGRPLTVMARRDQVFNMVGYRPESYQKVGIGARRDGTLTGITHEATGSTSRYEEFTERMTDPAQSFYACENVNTRYTLVPLDMSTPCWARGPGETSGSFALESAMDEMSYALQMDPLAFRVKNISIEKDPAKNLPWSSNYAKDCYLLGAGRFGWSNRKPAPRSMISEDGWLVGMGVAGGLYHANRQPATASATLRKNGTLLVQTSVADTGPGSATVMTQIAAKTFGCEISQVEFQWGNSGLPPAPGQFGSITTASTGSAVHDVVEALLERFKQLAINSEQSPFKGKEARDLRFDNGFLTAQDSNTRLSYADILQQNNLKELKVTKESKSGNEAEQFSGMSFCAHFVELHVHPTTGVTRMHKVVSAIDAGTIISPKTATNQVYGSVAWGIGIALMEEGVVDHRYGRYVNNNLADYHEPVNADIPWIDVLFVDKPDPILDPMGTKGLGEVGLVGFTAAVANAVYHATGKRIRSLPITADKLL